MVDAISALLVLTLVGDGNAINVRQDIPLQDAEFVILLLVFMEQVY